MPKRFLNVEYNTISTEIDVTDFEDLSDVQDAIKSEYGPAVADIDAPQLQLYTNNGSCAVIGCLPPPSRQPTQADLFAAGSTLTAGYKKRRTSEWEKVSTLAQLSYDPNLTIFELDTNYLAKTGLSTQKLILYCRPTFHEQFSFLREKVIDNGVLGWILGPPGTGKSTTALAFASTLDKKDWVVTWIHLYIDRYPVCVRLESDSKKSQEIYDSNIDKLFDILHKVDESKQHIVFIDGYTSNGQKHIDEEEYIHAVQNDEFFNHVKAVLDSDLQIDSSREDLVRSKLYFAGASARCMFLFATKDVIQQTYGLVTFVNDIFPYVKGTIGDQSNNVVDRLFSSSLVENDVFPRKTSIAGPDLIRKLVKATRHDGNPSMDGWMLEMWFFASLYYDRVKLFDENDNEVQTWPASNVKTLDINAFPALPENNGVWFKPNKWDQGGFDAIFLDKGKGLVRFVQVTDGNTRSFKIKYFHSFLLMLCQLPQSFEITCLEIIFVADQKKRSTFKVAEPSAPGMLTDFGWRLGEELDKVKVVFIKGWCD
ncbi:hypothetical protein BATDEDRAFT_26764 [Batrachochytrium dendrobatidis JAM81]|uniref:ATPase AAA-type core domain-containing protein n=1 Tax=Batrachochytrium dendrobatidis (strain JAM81 / FGSC 10211) TaxID=684364 RepID=F4P8W7_BATDJ|nr:uncharacterized protein BATDEDRAFT_26764 [Batrachochytrium dendrobatidis JAM81]EGF78076.1 hypothetical protein BATDEDRAFT_26764 [Batrachochytrium dendrobatidis JAM81]|eukprot:XP_006681047.1 hypothetical protein BATDEDRAFT_26764 [Batrachochytrium dendrobatidis JAM81]